MKTHHDVTHWFVDFAHHLVFFGARCDYIWNVELVGDVLKVGLHLVLTFTIYKLKKWQAAWSSITYKLNSTLKYVLEKMNTMLYGRNLQANG